MGCSGTAPGRDDRALGALARRPPCESGAQTDSQRIPYRYLPTETQCGVSGKSAELCRWLIYGGKDWQQRRERVVQVFLMPTVTGANQQRPVTAAGWPYSVPEIQSGDGSKLVPLGVGRSSATALPPAAVHR